MTDVKQTGAEIFAQVLEALDVPLAEWPVADPLLAALDGCVLLTASEADRMYDALIETPGKRSENWVAMRALLIPPEEPPPSLKQTGAAHAIESEGIDYEVDQPMGWGIVCSCGWKDTLTNPDAAHAAYERHVEEEKCDHGLPFSAPCEKCATDEDALNEAGCPTC